MIGNGALALFKLKPAVVSLEGDKAVLKFADGSTLKVRPKDAESVHPGPVDKVPAPRADGDFETAWQMAEGGDFDLEGLSELVFGEFTPASALACRLEAESGERFRLLEGRYTAVDAEARRREAEKRERKEGEAAERAAFVARARKGVLAEGDERWLGELEAFALGLSPRSKLAAELGLKDEPEAAHAWLLKTGRWDAAVDPWPSRSGLPLKAPDLELGPDDDSGRVDLTALESWAIDNAWSHDPDDAVAWDGKAAWIHVADPASAIGADSPAEREAADRGGTLYLPTGSIPMLPDAALERFGLGLSETSRALSIRVELGTDGEVGAVEIMPSFVKVRRSSYAEADAFLGSGPLAALDALARAREACRSAAGAVDIDIPETRVWVDRSSGKSEPRVELPIKARSQALVRELMVLGGEAAARWAFERGLPFPYYSQEAPSEPGELPDGLAGEFAKRRLMRGGMAGTLPRAHRGLGVSFYAQATSPLRRYADLLAHRQIRAALAGRPPLPADEVSERLARAAAAGALLRQAERASEAHWTLAWLAARPGIELDGVVVGSGSWGLSAFIPAIGLETRVKGTELGLNAAVRLRLSGVDLPKREARFQPVG